ncbi:hypothetical protein ARSEF4850_004317 [Beauveria asiatica]
MVKTIYAGRSPDDFAHFQLQYGQLTDDDLRASASNATAAHLPYHRLIIHESNTTPTSCQPSPTTTPQLVPVAIQIQSTRPSNSTSIGSTTLHKKMSPSRVSFKNPPPSSTPCPSPNFGLPLSLASHRLTIHDPQVLCLAPQPPPSSANLSSSSQTHPSPAPGSSSPYSADYELDDDAFADLRTVSETLTNQLAYMTDRYALFCLRQDDRDSEFRARPDSDRYTAQLGLPTVTSCDGGGLAKFDRQPTAWMTLVDVRNGPFAQGSPVHRTTGLDRQELTPSKQACRIITASHASRFGVEELENYDDSGVGAPYLEPVLDDPDNSRFSIPLRLARHATAYCPNNDNGDNSDSVDRILSDDASISIDSRIDSYQSDDSDSYDSDRYGGYYSVRDNSDRHDSDSGGNNADGNGDGDGDGVDSDNSSTFGVGQPPYQLLPLLTVNVKQDTLDDATEPLDWIATRPMEENGRTYHRYRREGSSRPPPSTHRTRKLIYIVGYPHPNDEKERIRLELQHGLLTERLGALYLAPIDEKKSIRVLDLGTGTGAWAVAVGDQMRQANNRVPPNVEFIVDDAEAEFRYNNIGFVFSRNVPIKDWKRLFDQVFQCLNPGGWAEIQFVGWSPREDLEAMPQLKEWTNLMAKAMSIAGFSMTSASDLKKLMQGAGFIDVREKMIGLPMNGRVGGTLQEWGKLSFEVYGKELEAISLALFCRHLGFTRETALIRLALVREEIEREGAGLSWPLYVHPATIIADTSHN